jgi:hypothetical protein
MRRKQKGSRSHPTTGNKGKLYLSDLQIFGAEKTDEENPHAGNKAGTPKECLTDALTISKRETYDEIGTPKSILGKNLPAFQWNIIFSMLKCPKTVRDLASEFSLDTSSIRQFLKRLIRHGIVSRVWRAYELGSDREACYYSSDPDVIEFCKVRKEAQP